MIDFMQKLLKRPDEDQVYFLQMGGILGDLTIVSIDSSSVSDSSLTLNYINIVTVETETDGEVILPGRGFEMGLKGGTDPFEYRVRIEYTDSDAQITKLSLVVFCSDDDVDYYGAAVYADEYFKYRVGMDAWVTATPQDKVRAMITATRAVDRLNFVGDRASESQALQFPRGTDTDVPRDVIAAVYEEAAALLDGVDSQSEFDNLSATSRGISSVRTTYDRAAVPENIVAGIVSHAAWRYLVPYLRDPGDLVLSRV